MKTVAHAHLQAPRNYTSETKEHLQPGDEKSSELVFSQMISYFKDIKPQETKKKT